MALGPSDVVDNAVSTDTTGTFKTIALPTSGVSVGDMMFMAIVITDTGDPLADVLTTPAGWTRDFTQELPATTSTPRAYLYWIEVPGGGLGASIDVVSSTATVTSAAVAFAVTNADTSALDVSGTPSTGTSTTLSCPAVTASGTGGLIVRCGYIDGDSESAQPTMASHTAINWQEISSFGNGDSVSVWVAAQPSTSVAAGTATITSEEWLGQTVVIAEAGASGNPYNYYAQQ